MALSPSSNFPKRDVQLAEFASAISHPARIAILKILAQRREVITGDLVTGLPLAQSTVSQHLKVLKEIGLIRGQVEGPRSLYCINWKNYERFISLFGHLADHLEKYRD